MPEPRRFFAQYGEVGHRATKSKVGEMYQVRQVAMALAGAAADSYRNAREPNRNPLAAELMDRIRLAFLEAPVGALMEGYLITYQIGKTERYIAVIPDGKRFEHVKHTDRGVIRDGQPELSGRKAPTRVPNAMDSLGASMAKALRDSPQ